MSKPETTQPKSELLQKFPFITAVLNGLAQIMLQENVFTGLLFLIGILYGSFTMGIAALLAASCGTLTAKLLKYDVAETEKGLYGFSAALVGVALCVFLKPEPVIWLLIIVGSILAAITQHFFIKKNIPAYTFPFILVTWVILFSVQICYPNLLLSPTGSTPTLTPDFWTPFRGYGQVIFQSSAIAGSLFFVAVFVSSPIDALYGLTAAVLAAVISFWQLAPASDIALGLFSYNAVLCAIVFAGNKPLDGLWSLFAVVVSVLFSFTLSNFQIIPLTFPFVAGVWCTLALKYVYTKYSSPI